MAIHADSYLLPPQTSFFSVYPRRLNYPKRRNRIIYRIATSVPLLRLRFHLHTSLGRRCGSTSTSTRRLGGCCSGVCFGLLVFVLVPQFRPVVVFCIVSTVFRLTLASPTTRCRMHVKQCERSKKEEGIDILMNSHPFSRTWNRLTVLPE